MVAHTDIPRRLALSYSTLARGLLLPSESDFPFRPFSAHFQADHQLAPESFREAARLAEWWEIMLYPADEWFERRSVADPHAPADYYPGGHGIDPVEEARIYRYLHRTMRATLEAPLHRARVHTDRDDRFRRTRYYLFGRVDGGGLAGLVALATET